MSGRLVHNSIKAELAKVPRIALEKMLASKLKAAGARHHKKAAASLAEHVLNGTTDEFRWNQLEGSNDVVISFDHADEKELETISSKLIGRVEHVVPRLCDGLATAQARLFVERWRQNRYLEERFSRGFKDRLEDRWGEGLDHLRVLVAICIQRGSLTNDKFASSRFRKDRYKNAALIKLHARACQISLEIVTLLENGFADGALARWRTLHEVAVVCLVLYDSIDDISLRYLEYSAMETSESLKQYLKNYESLGERRPSNREISRIERERARVVDKFGPEFAGPLGWAAPLFDKKRLHFYDLEEFAGRAQNRSSYKMASYPVHATSTALHFQVSSFDHNEGPLVGASNYGLDESGVRTANLISLVTYHLPNIGFSRIDRAVDDSQLVFLRDQAVSHFINDSRRLNREERDLRSAAEDFDVDLDLDAGQIISLGVEIG